MDLLVIIKQPPKNQAFSKEFFDGVIAYLNYDRAVTLVLDCPPSQLLDSTQASSSSLAKKFRLLSLYDTVDLVTTFADNSPASLPVINEETLRQHIALAKNVWII